MNTRKAAARTRSIHVKSAVDEYNETAARAAEAGLCTASIVHWFTLNQPLQKQAAEEYRARHSSWVASSKPWKNVPTNAKRLQRSTH